MRAAWLVFCAIGCATGCGDNARTFEPHEARSGDRIKLRWFAYDDGPLVGAGTRQWDPLVFQDTARDERCTVQRWSDGNTYCTPFAVPTVFEDPACTVELGRWLATQPPPAYFFREFTVIDQGAISRMFRRSDAAAMPATTYELAANGNCVETSGLGWSYYRLGEEVTRDAFARIRRTVSLGDERLALDAFTSDDGLYVPVEADRPVLRDRVLGGECKVEARANGATATCEPTSTGEATFSRDAQCTTTDVMVVEPDATVPDVVVTETDGCRRFARRGPEISAVPIFLPLGPSCVSVTLSPQAHLFEIGAPFDAPVLARTHEPSEHRLQRILISDGTTTVVDSLLFDRELGVDCLRTFITTAGGGATFRCLPVNTFATVLPYYADPACLEPIEISLVEHGACDPPTRFAIDSRGAEPAVRPLLAPYPGTLYEISTADECLAYVPPTRQVPFRLGAALPPETFVAATILIE